MDVCQPPHWSLTDLPDLVGLKIVAKLKPKWKLVLRQVCSRTKFWAEEDIRTSKKEDFKEIAIDESHTFSSFLNSGFHNFQFDTFHIRNTTEKIFYDQGLSEFIERIGPKIKKLKVDFFNACASDEELSFYEGLKNLEELEIKKILALNELHPDPSRIPENFKFLKVLKVEVMQVTDLVMGFKYFWNLLRKCSLLETFPKPSFPQEIVGVRDHQHGDFGHMLDIIRERQQQVGDNVVQVKFIDMINFIEPGDMMGFDFAQLAQACSHIGVKLMNVDVNLSEMIDMDMEIDDCIISLQNMNIMVQILPFANLEKIDIKSLKSCYMDQNDGRADLGLVDQEWPKLTSVTINFDIDTNDKEQRHALHADITGILLTDYERPSVKDLTLTFQRSPTGEMLTNCQKHLPYLTASIGESYCNLKNLKIIGWDALNKTFLKLWDCMNKDSLEELWLEDCRTLSNVCFIGKNEQDPFFLNFKNLQKLTLGQLNMMPKITDRCFRDVFSQMNLKEFCITSDQPLRNVTREGILFLASSSAPFSKSIRKFPFKKWSMEGVELDEFRKLESLFDCN